MNEVIAAMHPKPFDVLFQLLEENGGSVPTIYFHHDENDMRYALKQPFVSIGSDGLAFNTEAAVRRASASAILRDFPARSRDVCARRESSHAGRCDSQDDFRERGEDSHLRSRPAATRNVGGCHRLRSGNHHRQCHLGSRISTATGVEYVLVNGKVVFARRQIRARARSHSVWTGARATPSETIVLGFLPVHLIAVGGWMNQHPP